MLNEIYARHGYIFREKDMRKHFAREKWYKGKEKNMSKISLSPNEVQNVAFIKDAMKKQMSPAQANRKSEWTLEGHKNGRITGRRL